MKEFMIMMSTMIWGIRIGTKTMLAPSLEVLPLSLTLAGEELVDILQEMILTVRNQGMFMFPEMKTLGT